MFAGEKQIAAGDVRPVITENSLLGERSGVLPRDMGVLSVFLFAVAGIGLAYSGGMPVSTIAGMYPGSNLLLVLAAMLGVSLLIAYLYSVIGALVPHHGAEYILSSRVISPSLAFASSWTMVVMFSIASGAIAASVFQSTAPMFVQVLTRVSNNSLVAGAETWLQSPYTTVLLGTLAVVLIFLLLILPPHVTRRVLLVGAVATLAAWSILCWQLSTHQGDDFAAGFDRSFGSLAYLKHLLEARAMGMPLDFRPQTALSAGLLMALWVVYGFQNTTSFSGELKQTGRSLLLGMVLGLAACIGLLGLTLYFLQRAVPMQWIAAESFLYLHAPETGAMPWLPFYGSLLVPNPILIWFTGAAWIFSVLNLAHVFLYACSRVITSWSRDDLFPRLAGYIHPGLRSPVVAVLIVCTLAELGVVDTALNRSVLLRFNPLLFMVLAMVFPVVSVTILPFKRPDIFATAPGFARWRIGSLPGISVLGGIALVYLAYALVGNSKLNIFGGITSPSLLIFGVVFGLGLLLYYSRRASLLDQGRDIRSDLQKFPEQ